MGLPIFMEHWVTRPPDFEGFLDCLLRRKAPHRVPFAEFLCDPPIIEAVTGRPMPFAVGNNNLTQATIHRTGKHEWVEQFVDNFLEFSLRLGFDYLILELDSGITFAEAKRVQAETPDRQRNWWYVDPVGRLGTWEDLDAFDWPLPEHVDYSILDYAERILPEGMKILVLISGLFEPLYCLMGLETLSFALYDQPDLLQEIITRVAELQRSQVANVVERPAVGGVWMGDDLGYNTGTFVSPELLRQLIFPTYKELVDTCHSHGRIFLLHACGNLNAVMDDFTEMGIDAKHSFEDKILPVEEAYHRWGSHIGLIGGVDMDILSRGSEQQVRQRTRDILDVCGSQGGYALGSGNSIADYIPAENFLAMLDEGWKWNREQFGN